MTVAQSPRMSGPYTATAGQTVLDYDFPIDRASEIVALRLRGTTEIPLELDVDYGVTGVGAASGTIILTAGALEGDVFTLYGRLPIERVTNFSGFRSIPNNTINTELDRMTKSLQEMRRDVDGAIHTAQAGAAYDVQGRRIINVANGIDDSDAATVGQLKPFADAAQAAQAAAEAARDAAGASNSAASESRDDAAAAAAAAVEAKDAAEAAVAGVNIPPVSANTMLVDNEDGTARETKSFKDVRAAINVRGRVNFFDFLQATRSAAVREQISNGTFTGDLAAEWQAFRNALWAISAAGGRPHGYIPECTIHTSVSPNFAMDYLTLETQGRPRIVAIGAINALEFNGAGLGTGGLGVQEMKLGTLTAETTTGSYGVLIRECHRSEFDPILCNGAVTAGVLVFGCVSSVFRKLGCQPHVSPFVTIPTFGLVVNGNPGAQTSWCLFDMPIFEYQTVGILLDGSLGNTFLSGVAEGCTDTGLSIGSAALCNKFIGMDFEANAVHDIYCEGARNNFISVDSWSNSVFAGATCTKNKIVGGEWNILGFSGGASSNVVNGINYNSTATGYLADAGYGNVFRDNVNRVTGLVHNGPSDGPAASGWIAPGPAAIDITSQPLEDTMRTWTNPFAQSVEVLIDANATSVIRKTAAGTRFNLGAGGKSLTLRPGGKVQIGYSTIPNVQFFIL